jgi:CubicO group peptidase (beta-lactamase class C family)
MNHFAWAAVAAASLLIPASASAATSQTGRIARIEASLEPTVRLSNRPVTDRTLAQEMAAHHTPAISIAVVDHGKIVWAKAYGLADVATGRAATVHTPFQAGSISKPVAASGAMQLIQQGRLVLDKPANDQLKSWRIPDNDFTRDHPVTLRHLLTHTAGTTVHGFPGYAAGTPVPTVVQLLEGKPPANTPAVVVERQPGTFWNYSGGGITIAQLIMTDVTRQPFPQLMAQRVFGPVGMDDSSYQQPPAADRAPVVATGYLRDGKPVEGRYHTYPEMAAAGLWTTPSDLAKWAIALEQAYDGTSARLMSKASARTMLTEGMGHWGIGIELGGEGRDFHFTHGGDDWGFKANLMAWPSGGRAVVVMANSDEGMVVALELMQAVAREYGWKGLEPKVIQAASLSPTQAQDLAGSYGHGLVVISADGAELHLVYGGNRVELIPTAADTFLADPGSSNIPIKLTHGPDGKIKSLSAQGLTLARDP